MQNARSYAVASLSLCSVCFIYTHIYRPHRLVKTRQIRGDKLPSLSYLLLRYLVAVLTRRSGRLYATKEKKCEVVYTVHDCRLETPMLRGFCSVAGYGWDYPDSEYRDIPLCFPEFLCDTPLILVLTDGDFLLSPAGLTRTRQTLKTHQPVDELKKGPFTLQVQVLEYRQVDAGVEVDVRLSAASRSGSPVWESVLTLLSQSKDIRVDRNECPADETPREWVKQVELGVPWSVGLRWRWSPAASHLLSLPFGAFGCRWRITASLWMLSVCLAEVEKHKGQGVVTAPVSLSVWFSDLPAATGKMTVAFRETSAAGGLDFQMQRHGSCSSHVEGTILKS